jgi:1,4-alpha-glucan branching enzyme
MLFTHNVKLLFFILWFHFIKTEYIQLEIESGIYVVHFGIKKEDIYLFHEGTHFFSYLFLGAHYSWEKGQEGVRFSLWAPNARDVQVVGDFNRWQGNGYSMHRITGSGIWTLFIPGLKHGDIYKYKICAQGREFLKSDPYAFFSEYRPNTASVICFLDGYEWNDREWQREKKLYRPYDRPMNIYEVHLGSWKKKEGIFLNYRELAHELVGYLVEMGYTHVELMPLAEHPFDGSWGYQATGYYSVTSRYGTPFDFMYFVDQCHQNGIGVILDWVPGHFCPDAHGLGNFDGTSLYEYEDPQRRWTSDWGTLNFDLGKPEVISFLISNIIFWLDVYHLDGIRVDAVASMLYLDYGKKEGEWTPNIAGGNGNLEAVAFMQKLNQVVFNYYPNTLMIAEESTEWPLVSKPTYLGGLGYNYKWNMGWMNDILRYLETDFECRQYVHNNVTFSLFYAFAENFILPLSHDEVVHGKKSLLDKMPGDYWRKFAGLRAFYGFMFAHPGKKLLFMGGEFGQFNEWCHEKGLEWDLLDYEMHKKMLVYVKSLNHFYRKNPSFWELDHEEQGFCWINPNDRVQGVISFIRKGKKRHNMTIVVCNFLPGLWDKFRIGVPLPGMYKEIFNSDREEFGGSGQINGWPVFSQSKAWHNQPYSLEIKIPPLATVYLELKIIKYQKFGGHKWKIKGNNRLRDYQCY